MSESALVFKPLRRRVKAACWWGTCAPAKLDVKVVRRKQTCPLCGHDLVPMEYSGCRSDVLQTDVRVAGYVRDTWSPLFENGVRVWHVLESGA